MERQNFRVEWRGKAINLGAVTNLFRISNSVESEAGLLKKPTVHIFQPAKEFIIVGGVTNQRWGLNVMNIVV